MPWILNEVNKPIQVGLGSDEMMNAADCYLTEQAAKSAQREKCSHTTKIGIRATGHVQCADCGKPF